MTLTFPRKKLICSYEYYIPFYFRRHIQKSDQYPVVYPALPKERVIYSRLQIKRRKSCHFCRKEQ